MQQDAEFASVRKKVFNTDTVPLATAFDIFPFTASPSSL